LKENILANPPPNSNDQNAQVHSDVAGEEVGGEVGDGLESKTQQAKQTSNLK
jgi:hypothetical protein